MKIKLVVYALSAILIFKSNLALSSECDEHDKNYKALISEGASLEEQTFYWQKSSDECKNSGLYHLRIGMLYLKQGMYETAEEAMKKGIDLNDGYKATLTISEAQIYSDKAMRNIERTKNTTIAIDKLKSADSEFPNNNLASATLSTLYLDHQEWELAKKYANKSNSIQENHLAYRNLSIIHFYHLKSPSESLQFATKALELNKELNGDRDFMLAIAKSYAVLGEYENSLTIVKLLVSFNPGVRKDETFVQAVKHLQNAVLQNAKQAESKS